MPAKCRVITNNDIAYLWWSVPKKIPKCLGFSIYREEEGGSPQVLQGTVGFARVTPDPAAKPKSKQSTDIWPIQSFQWKDVFAPREARFRYHIYAVRGTPAKTTRDSKPIITTHFVGLDEQFGKIRVVFNRGLLSTQAMSHGSDAPAANANKLRESIATKGDKVRGRLAKELLPTIQESLIKSSQDGGTCYCALYELTDEELISDLESASYAEVVLSNANSSKTVKKKTVSVYDGTNQKARQRLKRDPSVDLSDRMLKGNSIGHNKFVVYADQQRQLTSVLTGSTNWTATGLCGQTNNALLIEDEEVASHYLEYWKRLRAEQTSLQGQDLRTWARENPLEVSLGHGAGSLKIWFSPNTKKKTKDADVTPVDMQEVFDLVDGAEKAVLFLLFNPGSPSIIDHIREVGEQRQKKKKPPLYVRGAISDAKTAQEGSVRVFDRSAKRAADTVITGVGAVPDDFGYWERELLKLGHAAIHDKVLVIDPFSKNCAVVTGSHNLGFKASYSNDENMLIIRGNRPIAEAFATHVLDVVNHYKWRYRLQDLYQQGKLDEAWQDLEDDDAWQDKYFDTGFLASRDTFVLS